MADQRSVVALALVAGLSIGYSIQKPNPQVPLLQANHYMQNSGEYRAACLQTYSWANSMLRHKVRAHQANLKRDHSSKPMAVIMDLDETVLDNTPFQVALDKASLHYNDELWKKWEEDGTDLGLVPGAKEFIVSAQEMGVHPYFITNRNQSSIEATTRQLNGLGIKDFTLVCKVDSSDKTKRRADAAEKYDVLMLVGDNLRDFSEEFKAKNASNKTNYPALRESIIARKKVVDDNASKFGAEWIILPNPVYGEFDQLKGEDPRETLRHTKFNLP